jgi:Cu/Ag efflux protein CusF
MWKIIALGCRSRVLWDAMIMGYKVNPVSLLKTVKPGDKVRFAIDTDKRAITKFEKFQK